MQFRNLDARFRLPVIVYHVTKQFYLLYILQATGLLILLQENMAKAQAEELNNKDRSHTAEIKALLFEIAALKELQSSGGATDSATSLHGEKYQ